MSRAGGMPRGFALLVACALLAAPGVGLARADGEPLSSTNRGQPTVKLNQLSFPDMPAASSYKKHLRRALRKEARRADWGAGRKSTIEYRFSVDVLKLETREGVLHIRCAATGRLPKGKTAKSTLTFGGDPKNQSKLIREVLAIVARGVITRLAELERARRDRARNQG